AGFEQVPVAHTRGTVYPGLIELHNHLPYDVLGLWPVPRPFTNRGQWSSPATPDYHRLISGPMGVLGRNPDAVAAIVRYVEVRCLLGGTTTSQGVALASNAGIVTHFRGLVRNVEATGDPSLPAAATHIADIEASDADAFRKRLRKGKKLLLHLAEGIDPTARGHFQALQLPTGEWAITPDLIGIHCAALQRADFDVFAAHGGSMVWSPLSNLLLYGQTADVGAALAAGVPIALGSDWAPSGSKNLLGELKIARLVAAEAAVPLSGHDLVAMATTTPARMLGWDQRLGSLEPGKLADLVVVRGAAADPYDQLLDATEAEITLVVINGTPRAGSPIVMRRLGVDVGATETVQVAGRPRLLNLTQADADPTVQAVTVATAIDRLVAALADLPNRSARRPRPETHRDGALLAVAGVIDNKMTSRLRPGTPPAVPGAARALVSAATPQLPALTLDPLTAVDNPGFYDALAAEPSLPEPVRAAIAELRPHARRGDLRRRPAEAARLSTRRVS
ncbi:MAG TPA: amidohydrolase family protein, partial [Jatrophihabitans sp.]|nr:amidohydrolase family protein [Jatrophihabitans sp.]